MNPVKVYLSRRNLLTLLSKLDRNKEIAGSSACTIEKRDTAHPTHPQTHESIFVCALEDEEYYTDRNAGFVHHLDEPTKPEPLDGDDTISLTLSPTDQTICIQEWCRQNMRLVSQEVFGEIVSSGGSIHEAIYKSVLNEQINHILEQFVINSNKEPTT